MDKNDIKQKAKETAEKIARLLADKQNTNIITIDVSEKSNVTDYFVLSTAKSQTNAKTVCEYIQETLEAEGIFATRIEGEKVGNWIVMDYTTVIVHIFHESEREMYKLERLWVEPDESNVTRYMGVK